MHDKLVISRAQCLYLPELKLVIALLPKMIITDSHLYIWMERGIVKENTCSLFQDGMATLQYSGALFPESSHITIRP